jgi:hypothetical protein
MKKVAAKVVFSIAAAALLALPVSASANSNTATASQVSATTSSSYQFDPIQWSVWGSNLSRADYNTPSTGDTEVGAAIDFEPNVDITMEGTTTISGLSRIDIEYDYDINSAPEEGEDNTIEISDDHDYWNLIDGGRRSPTGDWEFSENGTHSINVAGYSGPISFDLENWSGSTAGYANVTMTITAYDMNGNAITL